jgi:hypothetical protein
MLWPAHLPLQDDAGAPYQLCQTGARECIDGFMYGLRILSQEAP